MRVSTAGARFVTPAANGRHAHPLSRAHTRIRPSIPHAARAAAQRDPLGAVRRSARSLDVSPAAPSPTRATIRAATIHWTSVRPAPRDPRSWRSASRSSPARGS